MANAAKKRLASQTSRARRGGEPGQGNDPNDEHGASTGTDDSLATMFGRLRDVAAAHDGEAGGDTGAAG